MGEVGKLWRATLYILRFFFFFFFLVLGVLSWSYDGLVRNRCRHVELDRYRDGSKFYDRRLIVFFLVQFIIVRFRFLGCFLWLRWKFLNGELLTKLMELWAMDLLVIFFGLGGGDFWMDGMMDGLVVGFLGMKKG